MSDKDDRQPKVGFSVTLQLKKPHKKKHAGVPTGDSWIAEAPQDHHQEEGVLRREDDEPLVIPVAPNQLRFRHPVSTLPSSAPIPPISETLPSLTTSSTTKPTTSSHSFAEETGPEKVPDLAPPCRGVKIEPPLPTPGREGSDDDDDHQLAVATHDLGVDDDDHGRLVKLESEEQAAVEALQEEAAQARLGATLPTRSILLPSASSSTRTETQEADERKLLNQDLQALPDALDLQDDSYRRVPIAEFGAALLRGMGWQPEPSSDQKRNQGNRRTTPSEEGVIPRPARLGLGALPASSAVNGGALPAKGGRSQRQRELVLREQQQQHLYAAQRQEQLLLDRQRTLQNGSIVYYHQPSVSNNVASSSREAAPHHQPSPPHRAKILQLVGVPGLNQVRILPEGQDALPLIIKRGQIGDLVTRDDLEQKPFVENQDITVANAEEKQQPDPPPPQPPDEPNKNHHPSSRQEKRPRSSRDDQRPSSDEKDRSSSRSHNKRPRPTTNREAPPPRPTTWLIQHIRVRIVTEKLGRRYFREKGVVVDVTPKGAIVQLDQENHVLENIPERYLETALPKPGGKAIVLVGQHRWVKGRLLERDSRKSQAVLQVYEDQSVLTLSMDDLAEWCGPLDEDLDE